MVLWCELRNSKCFGNLEEAPQTERKGTPKRRESARRTGLRILGLAQKAGMVNVHLVVLNILAHWVEHYLPSKSSRFDSGKCVQPKSVRLQERKSTYCSAIWTLMEAASQNKRKYWVSATLGDRNLRIPQGRMYRKEIYNVLMQEFADFSKISVDVRYWLILSVNTGSNAGRRGRYRPSSQPVLL